jgi:hypothetical protein
MSTSDHTSNGIEALQRFYQAESEYVQTGGKDFGPVAATLHPQIVMIQADSLPFGGQWHGREGFERWMQAFGEAWSTTTPLWRSPRWRPRRAPADNLSARRSATSSGSATAC